MKISQIKVERPHSRSIVGGIEPDAAVAALHTAAKPSQIRLRVIDREIKHEYCN